MSDSIFPAYSAANYLTSGALTHYSPLGPQGFTSTSASTTIVLQRMQIGEAGDFSELRFQLSVNTYANPKSLNVQINGSASAITAAAPANTTGWFSDVTNTASVAAGDQLALGITTPNSAVSNWTLEGSCLKFEHATAVVLMWGCGLGSTGSKINDNAASATRYTAVGGGATTSANHWNATEANVKIRVKAAGNFKRLYTNVNFNASTNNAVLTFRVNGSDGAQTLTITAGATGAFSDATNSDAVVSGDDVSIKSVSGAGTVNSTLGMVGATFVGSSTLYDVRWARSGSIGVASGDRYMPLGATFFGTTEAIVQTKSSDDFTVGNLLVNVSSNSGGTGTGVAFRINGSDGTLVLAISSGATGIIEDTTHTDTVAVDDLINYRMTPTASTTIAIQQLGVTINAAGAGGGRRRRVFVTY